LKPIELSDHPDGRWQVKIYKWARLWEQSRELHAWLEDNIESPAEISYNFNNGNPYWSVAGGPDQRDQLTLCLLKWENSY